MTSFWYRSEFEAMVQRGRAVLGAELGLEPGPGLRRLEGGRQFRAYEVVSAALSEAAASGPVLAVVDDLHAADDASLGLLQLLAGDLHRMPVLCLFTVRDTARRSGRPARRRPPSP